MNRIDGVAEAPAVDRLSTIATSPDDLVDPVHRVKEVADSIRPPGL